MMVMRTGNRELIKEINRNIVLNLVRGRGPLSRTDIARFSGLSLATVSSLTAELLGDGFVYETGEAESTGGRRPMMLKLNPAAGYVVGLKLTETSIICALTDLEANVLNSCTTAIENVYDPELAIAGLIAAVEEIISLTQVRRNKIMGIGVGLAGMIDSLNGVCLDSPILGWSNVQIAAPIRAHFSLPVYIENDVNTLTIAEQWFGAGHDVNHFLVVTLGRGVGLGIVVNGQFYSGAQGGAGEFGHIVLEPNGPMCTCGKRGCLEALASDPAVLRMAHEAASVAGPGIKSMLREMLKANGELSIADISHAAAEGDALALDVLARAGRYVGLGIAQLVNILNPQLIILGGEGLVAGEARLGPLREALQQYALNTLTADLKIVVEPSGDDAWARGAACIVLGELFKHPIHRNEAAQVEAAVQA